MMRINIQSGFTLIELLLVIAMLGLVATFSVTLGSGFLWRTSLSQAQYLTVTSLRRAEILARSGVDDQDFGVHIEDNVLTIFEGNDFDDRNVDMDETYDLGGVTTANSVDVIYHKFSGSVDSPTDIDLSTNNVTSTISINTEGTINY